eukprot:8274255-Pyramimonas_sp.AAC.1
MILLRLSFASCPSSSSSSPLPCPPFFLFLLHSSSAPSSPLALGPSGALSPLSNKCAAIDGQPMGPMGPVSHASGAAAAVAEAGGVPEEQMESSKTD